MPALGKPIFMSEDCSLVHDLRRLGLCFLPCKHAPQCLAGQIWGNQTDLFATRGISQQHAFRIPMPEFYSHH